jgi:glycosyltransferase involved in cell wall biosynthesis
LKIVHIIDTLSPETGGPPEVVRMLARSYVRAGAEVEVVTLDDPGAVFLRGFPCRVHALGQSYLGRYAFSPRLWRWLFVHAARFDAIVMNGVWTFPGVCLYFATRRSKVPYGVFVHGALDPWFNRRYPLKRVKKALYWPLQYAVLRNAAAVFFTTETERELARTSFWPNAWNGVVIPYGIEDPESDCANPQQQSECFLGTYPCLRGRRHLLFLGRIHEKKGCDLLVHAFAPDVDLVMAGPDPGGLRTSLTAVARLSGMAERVHWVGMLSGDLKWGALRSCEAFVLPSHQENFGISVVEALAVGRPVLISNQVNIWRQVVADGAGFAEPDTSAGSNALLQRWLETSTEDRASMGERARGCFLKRFGIERAVTTMKAIFTPGNPGAAAAVSAPTSACAPPPGAKAARLQR